MWIFRLDNVDDSRKARNAPMSGHGIPATYFDGKRATAYQVTLEINASSLSFLMTAVDAASTIRRTYPVHACTLEAPLGQGPRNIQLPDGGVLELTASPENLAYLKQQWPKPQGVEQGVQAAFHHSLHWMENHCVSVCIALVGIGLSLVWAIQVGIPLVSEHLAANMPPAIERTLGEQVLSTLNQPALGYFAESQVPASQQQAIQRSLSDFCRQTACPPYRLWFKASPALGANAIAIPGGTIIVTDGLVNLATSPTQVVAILAHEMAHLKYHHGLRQTLQTSLSGLALLVLTNDVSSIAAGLPTLLINMQYSRAFEEEADADALAQLRKVCIPPRYFAHMLERLAAAQKSGAPMPEILASHPDTLKRMQPFLNAVNDCQTL